MDMTALTGIFSAIDWLRPSWDLFIVLFFVVSSLLYGISLGRDRILVIMISIYMALAVVKYVPYITDFNASISINDHYALKVSVFLGLFIVMFFLLSQSALVRTLGNSTAQGSWMQVIVFSILHAGLLISVTLSFFPNDIAPWLSQVTRTVFASDPAKAFWVIMPLFAMMALGRKRSEDD